MPITELPAELLVNIFHELRDMHVKSLSNRWLLITHVCQGWRLAALDAAELWTHIYSVDPACVQAFLTRSKNLPLDICNTRTANRGTACLAFLPMLLSQSSRLRRVNLTHSDVVRAFLMHPLPGGAPLLSTLYLNVFRMQPDFMRVLVDAMPRISEIGLPALRRLHVDYWPFKSLASVRGLVTPSLRALVIMKPSVQHPARTWGDLLTGLPRLETLALTHVLGPGNVPSAGRGPIPHIHLPLIEDDPLDQLSLLQHITASDDIQITFASLKSVSILPFGRYIDILHDLSQKFARVKHEKAICPTFLDLSLIHGIGMARNAFRGVEMRLGIVPLDPDKLYCRNLLGSSRPSPYDGSVTSTLGLFIPHLHAPLDDLCPPLCDMLCSAFSWSALRKLCLEAFPSSAAAFAICRSLFLQMTNLRVLTVANSAVSGCFLPFLGVIDTHEAEDGADRAVRAPRVLFPALEVLAVAIRCMDVAPLGHALMSRKAAGYPVSRVHLCCAYETGYSIPSAAPLEALRCSVDACVGKRGGVWRIHEPISAE